jgi:betaine-aldehyde dehydrogenase
MAGRGVLPPSVVDALPRHRDLYYGGAWHRAHGGYAATFDPATGQSLGD